MKHLTLKTIWGLALLALISCTGYLDEKPQKSILVPDSEADVRAILDYYSFLNLNSLALFIIADDWVTTSANWENMNPWQQNAYLWKSDVFETTERSSDYMSLHGRIFHANVCLDVLAKLEGNETAERAVLRGEALALRARVLFELSLLFLPGPSSSLADGVQIPVNLEADINAPLQMMGISQILQLATADLEEAFSLLPAKAEFKTRSDKTVAKALLARIYLYEENWEKALEAAAYVIENGDGLLEYSELDASKPYPFDLFNAETVLHSSTSSPSLTAGAATYIHPELYESYADNDLRKNLFFKLDASKKPLFKGNYTGNLALFSGISLPEMYLISAESAIRMGNLEAGLANLNALSEKRYLDFEEWDVADLADALDLVLAERRKELVYRGTRWMDMKRLKNLEAAPPVEREINGTVYTLEEEEQFVWKLPPYEIELGMK